MGEIRAFVCLDIAEKIKDNIERVASQIDAYEARAIPREQLHITLFFFERIDEKQVDEIKDSFYKIVASPFDVQIKGIGVFNPKKPNVIFATLKDDNGVKALYDKLLPSMKVIGFKNQEREFSPHITIARARETSKETVDKIALFVASNSDADLGSFKCEEIVLKQSTLTRQGPVYKTLFSKRFLP